MNGGSMFSGIGGFDEAMHRHGVSIAWQAEIDPFARRVLEHRFPGVRRINDVREIDDSFGPIDLLCAGWPCQDLSLAGLRAGLAGERSGLFREVIRVLELLTPQWFLLENVPGLYSSYAPVDETPCPLALDGFYGPEEPWDVEEDSDFEEVLTSLTECGYGVAWRCLDARYFDLAQRRERVLLVGCRGDVRRAAEVLFEPGSSERHPASRGESGPHHPAASLTRGSARASHDPGRRREDDFNLVSVAATLDSGQHELLSKGNSSHAEDMDTYVAHAVSKQTRLDGTVETLVTHSLRAAGCDASEDGTGRGTPLVFIDEHNGLTGEASGTLSGDKAGNRMGAIAQSVTANYARNGGQSAGNNGMPVNLIAWDWALAKTSQSMYGVRRLMPLECERLQGFPDGWTCLHDHPQPCDCPDTPRYAAIGNAVAVNVAQWVLGRLVAVAVG